LRLRGLSIVELEHVTATIEGSRLLGGPRSAVIDATAVGRDADADQGGGVSNLMSHANTPGAGPVWQTTRFGDLAARQAEEYDRRSPVRHLAGARAATLIVHGDRDSAVPVSQA
jgi:hypothetical protein